MPNSIGVYQPTPEGFAMWCYDQLPRWKRRQLQHAGGDEVWALSDLVHVGPEQLRAHFRMGYDTAAGLATPVVQPAACRVVGPSIRVPIHRPLPVAAYRPLDELPDCHLLEGRDYIVVNR